MNLSNAPAALVSVSNNCERYFLSEERSIIGRNQESPIILLDQNISRNHCVINKLDDDTFTICDLSSSGTFVNNEKLVKNNVQELHHRDKITFGSKKLYTYIFLINKDKDLKNSQDHCETLSSELQEKMSDLDNSYSTQLKQLNNELDIIGLTKTGLQEEKDSKLKAFRDSFEAEKLRLSNLVTITQEQKDNIEKELTEMKNKFEIEKDKVKAEMEDKYNNMVKKENELNQLKIEMELNHQKDRDELEQRFKAEIEGLKLKLAMSELEHKRLLEVTNDAKMQLAESEIEQTRLVEEISSKDDIVRDLQTKIKEKEEEVEKVIEDHLMCSICAELFIEPTVLNCGHMFCKTCIDEWKNKKKVCPMCRNRITTCLRVYNMDSMVQQNVELLSSEAKASRKQVLESRLKAPTKSSKKRKSATVRPYVRDVAPPPLIPPVPQQISVDLVDPFTWMDGHGRRRNPTGNVPPVAQIDLTVPIQQPTTIRTRNATVTSGLIDLTTP